MFYKTYMGFIQICSAVQLYHSFKQVILWATRYIFWILKSYYNLTTVLCFNEPH
jgi:hypothetical protein